MLETPNLFPIRVFTETWGRFFRLFVRRNACAATPTQLSCLAVDLEPRTLYFHPHGGSTFVLADSVHCFAPSLLRRDYCRKTRPRLNVFHFSTGTLSSWWRWKTLGKSLEILERERDRD